MCPTQMPRVAPEKRPSVSSATFSPICLAVDQRRDAEHLAHAGPAARALMADHQHVALPA
jgi:hypothetical protein